MRAAAAEIVSERLLDLVVVCMGVLIEQCFRLHDHAVDAIAALHRLLVDEGLLQRVRLCRSARPSSVVTVALPTALTGYTHERTACPFTRTVQAPHCARPHPKRGPRSPRPS